MQTEIDRATQSQHWRPDTWRQHACQQLIEYADHTALLAVLGTLEVKPGLLAAHDIVELQLTLAAATYHERFILQGGDCAEQMGDVESATHTLKLLHHLSDCLSQQIDLPVTCVGRMAGQLCKPRSFLTETQQQKTLPSYRGDLVNGIEFNSQARTPEPARLLQGYQHIEQSLISLQTLCEQQNKPLYTSHEALHLPFEQCLTRNVNQRWYNTSTHYPWLGMRTGDLQGAHVAYLKGIANPIAVKVGPNMTEEWIQQLVHALNPQKMPGRLTLIHRFGCAQIQNRLPKLIRAVQATHVPVMWSCDPMHGNTRSVDGGYKTRYVDDILEEWFSAVAIHNTHQSPLSGIHLEMTHHPVTECIGGREQPVRLQDLKKQYLSKVDPRLNATQAAEVITEVGRSLTCTSL